MGYYLEVPVTHGKAHALAEGALLVMKDGNPGDPVAKFSTSAAWETAPPYRAEIISEAPAWENIPRDKVLVVVVSNGLFEAAGVAYSESEYRAMTHGGETRPRQYLIMDRDIALKASGAPDARHTDT